MDNYNFKQMKFALKVLLVLAVACVASSLKASLRQAPAPAPAAGNATNASNSTSNNSLIAQFKDPSLKDNVNRDNILNNAFLRYIVEVIGYTNNPDLYKCIEAVPAQNKVNAIAALKRIWANRNEASVQLNTILQNIQCTQMADLVAKTNAPGVLDKLIREINQFIKKMRMFLRMFR